MAACRIAVATSQLAPTPLPNATSGGSAHLAAAIFTAYPPAAEPELITPQLVAPYTTSRLPASTGMRWGGEGDDGVADGQEEEGEAQPRLNGDTTALRPGPQSLHARHGPTHTTTPGSLQREYRAGGRMPTRPAGLPHPWGANS